MKLQIRSVLPLNNILRTMSNNLVTKSKKAIAESEKYKTKVSDEDVIRIRWLREVEFLTCKEIYLQYPHLSTNYINNILNYHVRGNVGLQSQFKQPHVSEAGTNASKRKMKII